MEFQSKIDCPTGIYKITNKITKVVYIGQTSIDLLGRWESHVRALENETHKNPYLQRTWNKHKLSDFIASVELYVPYEPDEAKFYEKLDTEERRILRLYPDHYNLMEAGEDRMIFSEESRQRASYSAKHRNITTEERTIWEANRLAAVRSIESCRKRSDAHKRMWADPEYRQILVQAYNTPEAVKKKSIAIKKSFTKERRAKYTKLNLDRWADPEFKKRTIENIKKARNNPISKELYSKGISKGWLKRKADPEYRKKNELRIEKIQATKAAKKLLKVSPIMEDQ